MLKTHLLPQPMRTWTSLLALSSSWSPPAARGDVTQLRSASRAERSWSRSPSLLLFEQDRLELIRSVRAPAIAIEAASLPAIRGWHQGERDTQVDALG